MAINAKRRNLSILLKLKAIKYLEKANSISKTADRFDISRKSVRTWRDNRESLESTANRRMRSRVSTLKTSCQWPILEESLAVWIRKDVIRVLVFHPN